MKFTIDRKEKYNTLKIDEEKLDSVISPQLKSEFLTLQAQGIKNIILDLSDVKYIDSSGLSSILVGNRVFSEADGYFILAGVSEHAMKLIKISQLDGVLNILPSVEEAVDAIFMFELEQGLGSEED